MSRRFFGQELHWRDLDLAQMPFWPNIPRRGLLALLAVALLVFSFSMLVWPQLQLLQAEINHIQGVQQQIRQTLMIAPIGSMQIPPARMIRHGEEPEWLAHLADTARQRQLNSVSVKVSEPSDAQRQQMREKVQFVVQQNAQMFQGANNMQLGWLQQTGMVDAEVQGTYAQILAFASDLGGHDEWLCVDTSELEAMGSDQVRWHVRLWYFKEATVKQAGPNAAK